MSAKNVVMTFVTTVLFVLLSSAIFVAIMPCCYVYVMMVLFSLGVVNVNQHIWKF